LVDVGENSCSDDTNTVRKTTGPTRESVRVGASTNENGNPGLWTNLWTLHFVFDKPIMTRVDGQQCLRESSTDFAAVDGEPLCERRTHVEPLEWHEFASAAVKARSADPASKHEVHDSA
jgi:hypothetical protein